ncbi:MAG: hypothetical protein K8Q99_00790 [Acholeplasmataceae bacterium]|nr:hypothetical protein [Acholeplasmataceae bacterium]
MKILLKELKEKTSLDFVYDFEHEIKEIDDILSIKPASIQIDVRHIEEEVILDFSVEVDMELACAKTLKPVSYHMDIHEEVIFGKDDDADFMLSEYIELTDIIFGYIISEKPYTIYHPDAKKISFEKEKTSHPAFAELDTLLKK